MRSAVIGGGSWGTALATVLANKGETVIWAREPDVVESINTAHRNHRYQAEFELPAEVRATLSLEEALDGAELVTLVVPSHVMRDMCQRVGPLLKPGIPIVSASKGIENDSLCTMEEVLNDALPRALRSDVAFLSGPSFAAETIARMVTAVTIAARYHDVATAVQKAFSTGYFRCYTTEDVTGVELGGALKNVIAIAAGAADGIGLGHNSRAALLTRGVAEITRLAVKLGANPLTLSGLAGMGDLVLTCTGNLSRNRHVGFEIGKGRKASEIIAEMDQIAEGVRTARSAYDLSLREGVDMPITTEVFRMVHEDKPAKQAIRDLMSRDLKRERESG
jgi:glycerol-3-phosphate dehydrogenase (NAD(P)+)